MSIKFLLSGITAIAIGTVATVSSFNFKKDDIATYIPRSSYHQTNDWAGAAEYYRLIKSNLYTGQIENDDIQRMNKALEKKGRSKSLGLEWASMGPTNVGGRTRAILTSNDNPDIVFAGGVSGGLFKSTNAGDSWQRIQGFDEHLPIGSIARLGNGTIYVGTGSSHDGANADGGSGFIGGGLFRSTDGGDTWTKLFSNDDPFESGSLNKWKYIDGLVADPSNVNKLWIGKSDGLYPYIDGNADLEPLPSGLTSSSACEDVEISGDVIIASIRSSISSKVYVSTDGGVSFGLAPSPVPATGRIAVAVSKDNNNYMYAGTSNAAGQLDGIFASVDKGANWYAIAGDATPLFNPYGDQGTYDNCITVVPGFPKKILVGGLTIFGWELVGEIPSISYFEPLTIYFGLELNPYYVHPDIHEFQWDGLGHLYVGCDGGVFKSEDDGITYYPANEGYVTTQFYGIGISNDGKVAGGTQDNGTPYLDFEGAVETDAVSIGGGDGFDTEISHINDNFIFTTVYNNALSRSTDNGNSSAPFAGLDVAEGGDFFTDIRLYENRNNPFSQIYQPITIYPELPEFVNNAYEQNGNSVLGYVLPNTQFTFESTTGVQLTQTSADTLFYYSEYNYVDSSDATIIDTITTIIDTDTIFAVDTTEVYTIIGDPVPSDSSAADTCFTFLGETVCYDLDTTYEYNNVIVDIIETTETTYVYDYPTTTIENVSDTLFARDYSTSILAMSVALGSGEIWITREPLKTNGNSVWVKAASGIGGSANLVTAMEWSSDGNNLYVGLSSGEVKRIGNWNSAWTPAQMTVGNAQYALQTYTIKTSTGGPVLGIGVDYHLGTEGGASQTVVIAQGSYGGSDKVRISDNAGTAISATDADFQGIWNVEAPFDNMPVYSVIMDRLDPNKIIAGTEYGIWSTDNGGTTWEESNGGDMVRVPVFEIRQQWRPSLIENGVTNGGVMYAGTHGAGILKSDNFFQPVGIAENNKKENLTGLNIFPNPIQSGNGNVQFVLNKNSNVEMFIFSINGKLIQRISKQNMAIGKNTISFNADQYATGTYMVQLVAEGSKKMGKFVVLK